MRWDGNLPEELTFKSPLKEWGMDERTNEKDYKDREREKTYIFHGYIPTYLGTYL